MISETAYYVRAFRFLYDAGYRYEGSGVYSRNGDRFRVRTREEWELDPHRGFAVKEGKVTEEV